MIFTTTTTTLFRSIAPGVIAAAMLALASALPAAAAPNIVITIPQKPKPPVIHIPSGNGGGNGGGGISAGDFPPIKIPPKPRTPIVILDDGVGSGGPGPDRPRGVGGKPHALQTAVGCSVKAPEGSTDNMWVINTGESELAAGTPIRFRVRSTGDHGAFRLNRSILPGGKIEVANLLHAAGNGAPCTVQIIADR